MSSKADELAYLAARGDRLEKIRDAAGMNGDQFAEAIVKLGADVGLSLSYDKGKVSRLEAGKATVLLVEEAVVIARLDPKGRGVEWLVLGDSAQARAQLRGPRPAEKDVPVPRRSRKTGSGD